MYLISEFLCYIYLRIVNIRLLYGVIQKEFDHVRIFIKYLYSKKKMPWCKLNAAKNVKLHLQTNNHNNNSY